MMNRRSDNSLRSSNPQWQQKKQQLPPLPPPQQQPQWKLPAQVLTLNPTTQQQQQQQLISQDQYVVEGGANNVQWPSSAAAYGPEQKFSAYNLWHWRQQQQKLLQEQSQMRLLLEQRQQQESYMNGYVNRLTSELPRPYARRDQGSGGGRSRLTSFLERDESFLTPWGKRDATEQGGEINSGGWYARVDGERRPEKMVFQYGSSFFSNQLN